MRIQGRRRLDLFFLLVGALIVGVITGFGAVVYNEARLERMWVGAVIDADGTAAIHEVIDDNFGSSTSNNHGLERKVPGLTTSSPFRAFSVDAPDVISSKTPERIGDEMGVAFRIGNPAQTVSGRHRYVLDYRLDTLVRGENLAWDAVGVSWVLPIEEVDLDVVAPWAFDDIACQIGTTGSKGECEISQPEPGHLHVHLSKTIDPGTGVTMRAVRGATLAATPTLPAAPAEAPKQPGAGVAEPAAVALIAAFGGSLAASRLVRRAGRERVSSGAAAGSTADVAFGTPTSTSEQLVDAADLADLATTEFAPPEGITPSMGGIIWAESVQPNHKTAWLIEAAIQGAIDLQEEGGKTVRIVRTGPGDATTQPILDKAFGGRDVITLGSYDSVFASGWSQLGEVLEGWSKGSGLWDAVADRRKTKIRVLGGLFAVVSLVIAGAGGALAGRWGEGWLALAAVGAIGAGVGLAAVIRGWELRVRTPAGSGLWLRTESFRRFLAESESYHAEEAAKRGVLREYTAWAVALGEIDHWKHVVEASSTIPQSAGLNYVFLAPMLASSTSHASTAPSSSGGGGGGGGVGGGGGGGGGGNW